MLGKRYNSSSGKNNNVLAKTILTINGLPNDSHPGGGEPGAPQGWSWQRGAGGGTPRGPRMGRARRSLLCTSDQGAFPAGRTCPGRGQAEGAAPARRAVPVPDFPASRVRPGSGPLAGARRPGTPGRRGPVPDAIFLPRPHPFSFWGDRAVAALGYQPCARVLCPEDLGVRLRREEKGDRAPGPPGAGQTGRPIAQMRRLRPPEAKIAHRRTGAPPHHPSQRGGCFGARVPRRRPQVSNPAGTGKSGATGLSTFQRAPRAAPGRSPAGLGLGGGVAGRERGSQQGREGSPRVRWWQWRRVVTAAASTELEPRGVLSAARGPRAPGCQPPAPPRPAPRAASPPDSRTWRGPKGNRTARG